MKYLYENFKVFKVFRDKRCSMAKVIKFKNEDSDDIYLLISNKGEPFLYPNKYLKFLKTINMANNTIKSYAYRLKLYWDFIELFQIDFKNISMENLLKYIGWLQGKSTINKTMRQPKTVNYNVMRSEEHTSELQSRGHIVCRLLLEK